MNDRQLSGATIPSPDTGSYWRRQSDGRIFEVVYISPGRHGDEDRIQLKPAEAKNLKNTRWVNASNLPHLYEPASAPPPPALAVRVVDEIGAWPRAVAEVEVRFDFPLDVGYGGWAAEAVEFVRRYPDAWWKWFDVPANSQNGEGWWSLDLYAEINGVRLRMDGPGGWTHKQGAALDDSLKAAKADVTPPPADPDHRCPRCTYGWSDDA